MDRVLRGNVYGAGVLMLRTMSVRACSARAATRVG